MNIQNKTFLVTGASGGIGKEMVALLLKNNAQVIAVDINDQALSSLMNSLSEHSGNNNKIKSYACDVSSKTDVDKLAQDVLTSNDGWQIDGLINCAGIIQPFLKINDLSDEAIKRVMDVNFFGVVYMTRAFLPQLLKRPEAHIVNYSSMGGFLPVPGQSVYGASKAAVKLFTEGLYAELISTKVKVSIVYPGATKTDIASNSGVNIKDINGKSSEYTMLSAEKSALAAIKGIKKNRLHIYTGRDSKTMALLYRIAPVFATRLIASQMRSLLKMSN